jgi:hypothetical protein
MEFNKMQVDATKTANNEMKKQMDLDDALEVMDNAAEEMEKANELSEALSTPMGGQPLYDEDDLLEVDPPPRTPFFGIACLPFCAGGWLAVLTTMTRHCRSWPGWRRAKQSRSTTSRQVSPTSPGFQA